MMSSIQDSSSKEVIARNPSIMRASIPKKISPKDYDESSFVNSEALSSESTSSQLDSSPSQKKKLPSRTVNMVELSYGDFQVLQFPYVDGVPFCAIASLELD